MDDQRREDLGRSTKEFFVIVVALVVLIGVISAVMNGAVFPRQEIPTQGGRGTHE